MRPLYASAVRLTFHDLALHIIVLRRRIWSAYIGQLFFPRSRSLQLLMIHAAQPGRLLSKPGDMHAYSCGCPPSICSSSPPPPPSREDHRAWRQVTIFLRGPRTRPTAKSLRTSRILTVEDWLVLRMVSKVHIVRTWFVTHSFKRRSTCYPVLPLPERVVGGKKADATDSVAMDHIHHDSIRHRNHQRWCGHVPQPRCVRQPS